MDLDQNRAPVFEALQKYVSDGVVPFHVPGHKLGEGCPEFARYVGERIFEIDVNGMPDLDNASNPIGVIKESEALLAQLYGADHSFFLVNGTSHGVQAMIMNACSPGDEILIPRNAHKSTIGGLILSGAIPVYVQPEINYEYGIALGLSEESLKRAISRHPNASAVFIINPTYYGMASNLKEITRIAHDNDMLVLADEAHGAHMLFHRDFPITAMEAGADMSAISLHKTGGSMTQTAALLVRTSDKTRSNHIRSILNITQTTSASYVLMASIDLARKRLALEGTELMAQTLEMARYARQKINEIEGLYAFGDEMVGMPGVYDFDETKLSIHVRKLGMSGFEMEEVLRKEYNIQIELSDLYNIMAIITLGDTWSNIERLVDALKDIAAHRKVQNVQCLTLMPYSPKMIVSPRDAYYNPKKVVKLENTIGEISGEMIMAYPPGIPVICPGERFTREVVDYVMALKREGAQLQGTEDPYVNHVKVLGRSY